MALLLVALIPGEALAWSHVTHTQLGRIILAAHRDFLSMFAGCVLQFPRAFWYGCIAPDRFLAKNLKQPREHTHGWSRAFTMFQASGTDELRSFSYGYLAHLAADVVAHNVFVPAKVMGESATSRRHAYWELRFEKHQPQEAWQLAHEIQDFPEQDPLNHFMQMFQSPSLFSFNTNMQLTRKAFRFLGTTPGQRLVRRMGRRTAPSLEEQEVELYTDLCIECILDVIRYGQYGRCADIDPSGLERIRHARQFARAVTSLRTGRRTAPPREEKLAEPAQIFAGNNIVLPVAAGTESKYSHAAKLSSARLALVFKGNGVETSED
jgi:hypothetical protein